MIITNKINEPKVGKLSAKSSNSECKVDQTKSEEQTLTNRGYKLIKKIGEGSYANVYLAEYTSASKTNVTNQLACKVVNTTNAPYEFINKFFPRELEILIRINHPHIIHIHSIFQRRTKYFIFMRYAENGDLLDYIIKYGPIHEAQARVWIRQLTLAVQYLHDRDIAHRDLKCENTLITANFNIKLADFGFARCVGKTGKNATSSTYCGSLSYAAPEILRGTPYYPKLVDIWSLGIMLYVMLNEAMPFDDSNVKWLYEQQMRKRWKFRTKVIDKLSYQVKSMIRHLLEPDITTRWSLRQILNSDWIRMDPRLLLLSSSEKLALDSLQAEKKKTSKKDIKSERRDMKNTIDIKVFKPDQTMEKKSSISIYTQYSFERTQNKEKLI